jgi:hypothetical protein
VFWGSRVWAYDALASAKEAGRAVIPSSAETGRSVYEISLAASDTEQATTVIASIFCPDPDHEPPCPVPWESRSMIGSSVTFVFYATNDQAQQILAEVTAQGFSNARLFESIGEDGQPIDGETVIEQFQIERGPAES